MGAGEGGGGGGRVGGIGERPLPPPYYTHVISASGFESLRYVSYMKFSMLVDSKLYQIVGVFV